MRPVSLAGRPAPNASTEAKVDWCLKMIEAIALASQVENPNVAADQFALSNVTASRTLDADTATTAQIADVLGTFLQDLKRRGAKRTA